MTIVMSVMTGDEICLVADCRIATVDRLGTPIIARDVCQKLFVVNGWSVVGFAGDLCLGRDLLRAVYSRIAATPPQRPSWLRSDAAILDFISKMVRLHVREIADHTPCQRRRVELLIAWMDYRTPFARRMEVIAVSTPDMSIRRSSFGIEVIGTGAVIREAMERESFISIISSFEGNPAARALLSAGEAAKYFRRDPTPTVGGLYQIAALSAAGAEVIPHFQFVPLPEPWVGTYVAMRMRGGMWLQEHRPTGTLVKVMAPYDVQIDPQRKGHQWRSMQLFDPASDLRIDAPGVIRVTPPWVLDFCRYDPANVPEEVRRSWGDDPLEPLSWAQGPTPKRWRK